MRIRHGRTVAPPWPRLWSHNGLRWR